MQGSVLAHLKAGLNGSMRAAKNTLCVAFGPIVVPVILLLSFS